MLALAGLSFQIGRRTTKATDQALLMARQISGVDRAVVVPFESLSTLLTPDTMTSGSVKAIVRYVIDSLSYTRRNIYVITSTTIPGMSPDTVIIPRAITNPIPLK